MKLTIDLPNSVSGLIHSPVDDDFLILMIRKCIESYVYETPRLVKNQNATPVLIMRELMNSNMSIEKCQS